MRTKYLCKTDSKETAYAFANAARVVLEKVYGRKMATKVRGSDGAKTQYSTRDGKKINDVLIADATAYRVYPLFVNERGEVLRFDVNVSDARSIKNRISRVMGTSAAKLWNKNYDYATG